MAVRYPVKSWRIRVAEVIDKDGFVVEGYKRVIAYGRINSRTFGVHTLAIDELLARRIAAVNQLLAASLADSALQFLDDELTSP